MKNYQIRGISKSLFILRVKLLVALYFVFDCLRNRNLNKYIMILRRLNYFIGKLKHNKFVQIGDYIRFDMYIPGFPSKAFFTACKKFTVFNEKLPCTVALISVTSACSYHCQHCYQRLDIGNDVDINQLISAVKYLQDQGIAFFNIEGGEPFLTFDRLLTICRHIDKRSEIWINSTGNGITIEKLLQLKETSLTVIMFSLHSHDSQKLNAFMGVDNAWQNMVEAIEKCHQTGIPIAFNSCLALEDFSNGNFEELMQQAKDFGASLVQLIKPKPSGAWLESGVEIYSAEDFDLVKVKVNLYNLDKRYQDFPAISAQIIEEDPDMFGCTAGGTDRLYINAKGDLQPCEFLNLSFGNMMDEPFSQIFLRMRKVFDIPQTCIACEKYSRDIHQLYQDHHLKSLPLNPVFSKQIFDKMSNNSPTRLYEKIEKELK